MTIKSSITRFRRPFDGERITRRVVRYDDTDIADRYEKARELLPETLDLWMEAVRRVIPASEIETVIDVGCGTGRFCAALQDTFSARVIGVDPSLKMLAEAGPKTGESVEFRPGSAEEIPAETESACLLFLSMVYHHIEDTGGAVREFRRVLRPSGYVCIRNSTIDLLDAVPYLRFFPEAREWNARRLPLQAAVVATVSEGGFSLVHREVVDQVFARSWEDYHRKLSYRGLSDLASISDEAFECGLARLKRAAEQAEGAAPVIEPIDLFVFQKGRGYVDP